MTIPSSTTTKIIHIIHARDAAQLVTILLSDVDDRDNDNDNDNALDHHFHHDMITKSIYIYGCSATPEHFVHLGTRARLVNLAKSRGLKDKDIGSVASDFNETFDSFIDTSTELHQWLERV